MKKFLLYFAAIIIAFSYMLSSCKKTDHPTHPTPGNVRLLGYKVTTTPTVLLPSPAILPVISASYSFSYDGNNRLAGIDYTTNDSNLVKINRSRQFSTFTYSGNTIYKTTSLLTLDNIIERDTFIQNGSGQITNAYFPFITYSFSYYGVLLVNETVTARDSGTTISGSTSYTSNSGDFLKRIFDGNLHATFPDSGIRSVIMLPDTTRDTILSLPLTVTWTTFSSSGIITHNGVNANTDQISGYSGYEVILDAVDPNGVRVRTVTFPADAVSNQTYTFYGDQNRIGDYLQLQSFTTYGVNVYQNANLVKNITSPVFIANATYVIDADSKITHATVTVADVLGNPTTSVYDLQYETY